MIKRSFPLINLGLIVMFLFAACGPSATNAILTATETPITLQPTLGISSTRTRGIDGMVEVYVPAGEFLMGSTDAEISQGCGSDTDCINWAVNERPQHSVTPDAYWIDQTEVTNAQYARCVVAGSCSEPVNKSSSKRSSYYGNTEFNDYPVIYVNWAQASGYCTWAGGHLPTEAQWEKAARGPDGRIYPWGSQAPDANLANFNSIMGDTTKVGSYPSGASIYGALDMAGNVWEWVADWYGSYSGTSQGNPTGPASGGDGRVLRGGSWSNSYVNYIRSSLRYGVNPAGQMNIFGFRCVR